MDKVLVPFLLLLAWAATTYLGVRMLQYAGPARLPRRQRIPIARVVGRSRVAPGPNLSLLVALGVVYASVAVMFVWPVGVLISALH